MNINILLWGLVALVLIGGAVILGVIGARYARNAQEENDPLMNRLAEASQRGELTSLEDIELSQPFSERILVPFMRSVGEFSARFTPQKALQDTSRKLELAGNPGQIDAATFLASRFVVAGVFGGLMLLISFLAPNPWPLPQVILLVGVFLVLGFFFPQLWY